MKKVYFIPFGLISIISFHCQKEVTYVRQGGDQHWFSNGEVTIQGNVVDENGQPAVGAAVKSGNKTTTTDPHGYFRIAGSLDDKGVSVVTAERDGYFKAYRSLIATAGVNQVVIKLVKKDLSGIVNSTTGGDVSLPNGSKISLPARAIIKASGGTYEGAVNLYAAYIDPTSKDISETIPGSLMADNKNGKRVSLTSFGMLAVQLESPAGEKLQIAPGSTATLTVPIPSSLQSSAPGSISLWYVDEQTGIWKEEGTATKTGNKYVGTVKHFSFWNCDIGETAIKLYMTLQSPDGSPMIYTTVKLTLNDTSRSYSSGATDSLGEVSGLVPADKVLLMEVTASPCYDVVYSQTIGPFYRDTDLGQITVNANNRFHIYGKLMNCAGLPVADGYAVMYCNNIGRYLKADNLGNFTTELVLCPGSLSSCQIIGVDDATQQQGNLINVDVVSPATNVGNISACGTSSEQYFNYTVDGADHSITSTITDSLIGTTEQRFWISPPDYYTNIYGTYHSDYITIGFVQNNSAGTFPLSQLALSPYDSATNLIQPFNITISNYPQDVGEFYEGHFSGQFTHYSTGATLHNIDCSFRIRRKK